MPLRCDEMLKRGRRIGSMIAERCPWDVMRWWEWRNEKEKWDDENVPMRRRALEMKRGGEVHVSPIKIIGIIMVNCRNMSLIWDDENAPMRRRAVEMKRGRRSTRGMLREEVTGIHWRIDGRRSSHYYQLNHRGCDETWGHGWFEGEPTRHSAWGQDKDKDKDNETWNN